jgi:hypothetical protein
VQKWSQTEGSKPSGMLLILSKSSMAFINWAKLSLFNLPDSGRSPKGTILTVSACAFCLWTLILSRKAHQHFIFTYTEKKSALNNKNLSIGMDHSMAIFPGTWKLVGGLFQSLSSTLSRSADMTPGWTTDIPDCCQYWQLYLC